MAYKKVFKRSEIKYIITKSQYLLICGLLKDRMHPDEYGKSVICNLYLDTPDFLLIRRSIEKPVYKEKLRVRSYGVATNDTPVYLELKKKFKGVVYKRRVGLLNSQLDDFLDGKDLPCDNKQVEKEIRYALNFYKDIKPRMFLSYVREAFYGNDDKDFRITFDSNIIWRDYDLSLSGGVYGNRLLDEDTYLMEVKTETAIPMWLSAFLSQHKIFKQSFSKYGTAYTRLMLDKNKKAAVSA
ncbi:MAG: polyphosphate polymerase domain-containing protein [Clostridia bacterium]|nr:polyphosphate polymerase domain-containing protein [Clostridia bacterium]MBQ4587563.1 polyphosphate polymerase domain-containing protein [Clostridia bacterium]